MINRETAIEIARKRAEENGWRFVEPLEVVYRVGWFGDSKRFEIRTNIGKRGGNAYFVIDAVTGEILLNPVQAKATSRINITMKPRMAPSVATLVLPRCRDSGITAAITT